MNLPYPAARKISLTACLGLFSYSLFSQPIVNSFSPAAGPADLQVVIRGSNFGPSPASNLVRFGVARAQVLSATADSLLVRVPAGANYQELTVTTGGLIGTCSARPPFLETFSAGGAAFSAGSFSPYTTFPVDGGSLSVADLNGDNKPDLVTGALNAYGIVVGMRGFSVLNNSSDTGTVNFSTQHFAVANAPFFSTIADMNGDGKPDIVAWDTAAPGSNQIAIYLNNGSGSTISFDGGTRYAYGSGFSGVPVKMIVRDLDGDGKPDVLTTHSVIGSADTTFFTFLQNTASAGTISLKQLPDLVAQSYNGGARTVSDFVVEDFDGDGKPDILAVQGNGFYFYQNTSVPGAISFAAGAQTNYMTPGTPVVGLTAADLDGDGHADLIYLLSSVYTGTYQLDVMWNNGQPNTPSFWAPRVYATGLSPEHLAVGDLDGDGKPDLVVSNFQAGTVGVYRNTCSGIRGSNDISFDPPVTYYTGTSSLPYTEPNDLEIVDVDGDRRPDIVVALPTNSGNAVVLRNLMPYSAAPLITAVSPMTATAGSRVGISGTNFSGSMALTFGGVPANSFTVNSPDSITAVVGNGATGQVVLTAPGGSDTVQGFTYVQEAPPSITSFTPDSVGYYGLLTIKGQHFTNVVSATAGGVPLANLTLVSDSVLTGSVTGGTDGYVAVFTTAGADSAAGFTYIPQAAVILYFSPTNGGPGDSIRLVGNYFTGTTGVTFGAVPAASFQVLNDSMMIAIVGQGASGAVTVTHSFVSGSISGFTYTGPARQTTFNLRSFSGNVSAAQATLSWKAINDESIAFYTILEGRDTTQMNSIQTVTAQHLDSADYTYIDGTSRTGVIWYRLVAQDTSGNQVFNGLLSLVFPATNGYAYPNPVSGSVLQVPVPDATVASQFELTDVGGRVLLLVPVSRGTTQAQINLSSINPGAYMLSWSDGSHRKTQMVLIMSK